jgi:hypothetical protein
MTRMMNLLARSCLALSTLLAAASAAPRDEAPTTRTAESMNPHVLILQVEALQAIHDLDLNRDQLTQLKSLAEKVNAKPVEFHIKMVRPFRMALAELWAALVADDDGQISDAQDKVQDAREGASIGPDPVLEISPAAAGQAKAALALLTPGQVAQYVADHADDVPDPQTSVADALDAMGDANDEAYASLKSTTAEQVATILHGLNTPETADTQKQVEAWLDKVHALSKADRSAQRADLLNSAAGIIGHPDAIDCLRHWLERDLGELLTNPQLRATIDIRSAKAE